ncbi:uncharacterized protein LOC108042267 [Drosophila rhopaloa]|uniref:Uncharacterized protein LOC108042267 n=1 Tax=Drosophila rhopaloa TaxID=1041015 RepID=A0A6P4ERW6_DRORH|nr:uncharacterized protein LOC108042267 [Drosophila rhopaloa]
MRTQMILVTICICLCIASAEDLNSNPEIRGDVIKLLKGTEKLVVGVEEVKRVQKGIEEKFKHQRDEIELIAGLEGALAQLEGKILSSFQETASGVGNLTAIVKATQSQNEQAIQNLTKVELDIRSALGQLANNQNKYEQDLDAVASSVNSHLGEIQQLIGQAVISQLFGLDNKAKVLQQQQRNIIGQVGYLEQLNGLADRANRKVNQLEWGLVILNRTQSESLKGIENTVHGVQVATSQIDNKLGALLDNQKSIEKTLEGCKRQNPPNHKPHEVWTHPEYAPGSQSKPSQKPGFESRYASEEEADYLHKLWYGKRQEE